MPRGRSPCTQAPSAPSISELSPRCFQGRIASVVLSSSAVEGFQNLDCYCCSLCEKTARVHSADATVQPPPLGRGPVRGVGRVAERERGPGDQLATSTRSYQ